MVGGSIADGRRHHRRWSASPLGALRGRPEGLRRGPGRGPSVRAPGPSGGPGETFFGFFRKPPCAAAADVIYYAPVRHPARGASRSLRRHGAKSARPDGCDPRGGSAGRGAEHEREKLVRAGAARSRRRDERFFFSESLILAQNERW